MEAYKAQKLPFKYNVSDDLFRLICNARETYGEYKGYLKSMSYDYKSYLETAFINDTYYSFKIDNSKLVFQL